MTRKLFLTGGALSGLAVVESIGGGETPRVVLSQTLFHPQGGGQRADTGRLCYDVDVRLAHQSMEAGVLSAETATTLVTDVRCDEDGATIFHRVEDCARLEPGMTVMMLVDAGRRRLHSRLHSAGHLLADVVRQVSPGLVARTAHHWPGEARVEFEGEAMNLAALEAQVREGMAAAISRDLPVTVGTSADGVRIVTIGEGAPVPCGGTHVPGTAELAGFRLRSVAARKGLIRVSYDVVPEPGARPA